MRRSVCIALLGLIARSSSLAPKARGTVSYNIDIPSAAAVVSDWESLYSEVEKYPNSALVFKHGGWIIEMDQAIVLAVDDSFIEEISNADPVGEDEDPECDGVEEEDENGNLVKRCNHARCFMHSTCRTYTGCYVCRIRNVNTGGGNCI